MSIWEAIKADVWSIGPAGPILCLIVLACGIFILFVLKSLLVALEAGEEVAAGGVSDGFDSDAVGFHLSKASLSFAVLLALGLVMLGATAMIVNPPAPQLEADKSKVELATAITAGIDNSNLGQQSSLGTNPQLIPSIAAAAALGAERGAEARIFVDIANAIATQAGARANDGTSQSRNALSLQDFLNHDARLQHYYTQEFISATARAFLGRHSGPLPNHFRHFTVLFDYNSAVISRSEREAIQSLAKSLEGRIMLVIVMAYADTSGDDFSNFELSRQRAAAVEAELAHAGVVPVASVVSESERKKVYSWGEDVQRGAQGDELIDPYNRVADVIFVVQDPTTAQVLSLGTDQPSQ